MALPALSLLHLATNHTVRQRFLSGRLHSIVDGEVVQFREVLVDA